MADEIQQNETEYDETSAAAGNAEQATDAVAAEAVESETQAGVEEVVAAESAQAAEAEDAEEEIDPYAQFKVELRMKPGKWYVIHTYAGFERKVRDNLEQRVENKKRSENLDGADEIYEIQVPMEDVVETKNGQRKMVTRVRIPGYVLVRMHLTEDSWSLVRQTPGVTGFVGNAHDPVPLRFKEVFEMLKSTVQLSNTKETISRKRAGASSSGQPTIEVEYEIGETITIKEGSFEGLTGTISEINAVAGKLTVLVSLFGRETPVELSFDGVAKL